MSVGTHSVGSSVQAIHIWGEEAIVGIFFTHYQCPHMDLRRFDHCSEYYPIFPGWGAVSFSHGSVRVLDLAGSPHTFTQDTLRASLDLAEMGLEVPHRVGRRPRRYFGVVGMIRNTLHTFTKFSEIKEFCKASLLLPAPHCYSSLLPLKAIDFPLNFVY